MKKKGVALPESNIYLKLFEASKVVGHMEKDDSSALRYKFHSHEAVTEAVAAACFKVGLYYYADVEESSYEVLSSPDGKLIYFTKVTVAVTFVDVESPDQKLTFRGVGIGLDPSDKSVGKAVSYAVKYALLKGLMCRTGDNPEKDDIATVSAKWSADSAKDSQGKFFDAPRSTKPAGRYISDDQRKFLFGWGLGTLHLTREQIESAVMSLGYVKDGKASFSTIPVSEMEAVKGVMTLRAGEASV